MRRREKKVSQAEEKVRTTGKMSSSFCLEKTHLLQSLKHIKLCEPT